MPTPCDAINQSKYRDLIIQANQVTEEVELKNRETGETSPLFSYDYLISYRVYGSYVIVQKYTAFLVMNLSTGEKTIYDVTQCHLRSNTFTIKDYIVKDGIMYVTPSISNYMIVVDLETGTMKYLTNKTTSSRTIDRLYIAGEKMYAYLNLFNEGNPIFTELIVSENNYCFE